MRKQSNLLISLLGKDSFKRKSADYLLANRPCFAILKLGGEVVEDELDVLVETCAFLSTSNLVPAICHGGGPQLNKALEKRGVKPNYIKGSRVTDEKTLEVAVQVFTELNTRICDAFSKAGIPHQAFPNQVFEAKIGQPELGLVGQVCGVHAAKVLQALEMKKIPVLTSLGFSREHPNLNINADVAARELALAIKPLRVIYTSAKGGWTDDVSKKIVPNIVLSRDYERLAGLNYEGRQGTLLKLNEIKSLLEGLPAEPESAVTIASCSGILTELFSPSGTGTGSTFVLKEKPKHKDIKVGLVGARGYVGREVVKLIAQHPRLDLAIASSRAFVGKSVAQEFDVPNMDPTFLFETLEGNQVKDHPLGKQIDVWILALPNGLAPKWVEALSALEKPPLIIDLGADYRFNDSWTYGLPERKGARKLLTKAKSIANPGCYATGAQIGLMPLVHANLLNKSQVPAVFGLSGYSGAGTTPSDKNNPVFLKDNIIPYSLVNHIHEREVTRQLGAQIAFMPHVAPYFQGIALTITAQLNQSITAKEVFDLYAKFYANDALVKVTSAAPLVRDNMKEHFCAVGGFTFDEKTNRLAMHVTIDNLLKGAATQCIQNINLAMGFEDEYAGILKK